ncbi:hypothetical protein BHE74_00010475 [Ensete ventricosum]|nr:hypothetical protein GW17_00000464 [Ensete ventricosum]RWW81151.1 hypothetical protein BHE74_00010475 [Ensete ventricosum]
MRTARYHNGRYRRLGLFPPRYRPKSTVTSCCRAVTVNFDHQRPISCCISRGREKEEEGEEKPGVCFTHAIRRIKVCNFDIYRPVGLYISLCQVASTRTACYRGWLFSSDAAFWRPPQMRALLHSVPIGKMIVLDLFAEVKPIWRQSSQFYGVPYVWYNPYLNVGVGMCMEGIEQNPVVYELMSEMGFRSQKVELKVMNLSTS